MNIWIWLIIGMLIGSAPDTPFSAWKVEIPAGMIGIILSKVALSLLKVTP